MIFMKTMIWPVYIDSNKTRKEGRKISKEYCVERPKVLEIAKAARKLKLKPETENDKAYPGFWWEDKGRVFVDRGDMSKNEVLIKIAQEIRK